MINLILLIFVLLMLFSASLAFKTFGASRMARKLSLHMGRAAAVRAATKGKTDAAKAKNNNRFAKKIIMVVKAGGGDPDKNKALFNTIAEAKVNNVPMDVIKRNIDKAAAADTADFKESLFEFMGAGGVGFLVNVLTDNDNRACNEINLVGKKANLKAANGGSVAFNYDKKSRLDVPAVLDEDAVLEMCLEAGVDDFELRTKVTGNPTDPAEEGNVVIYVDMTDMQALREQIIAAGHDGVKTQLQYVPKAGYKEVSDEDFEKNMDALEKFEGLDDVDSVDHDMDLSDLAQ